MKKVKVKPYGRDHWLRQLYKTQTGQTLCDAEDVENYGTPPKFSGTLHTITEEGEPNSPVKAEIEIVNEFQKHNGGKFYGININ